MTAASSTPTGIGFKKIPNAVPLHGFVPRMVTAKQVQGALVREDLRDAVEKTLTRTQDGDVNPFNNKPHSAQYRKILEVRKKLPVYAQMTEFFEVVSLFSSI
jgi:pre-mRNA-splicing factor ATP-dependent RNA helicase DHX15/PRP43